MAADADCLEQAYLVQEYHLVVLICIAGYNSTAHKDLHKERIQNVLI